MSCFEFHARAQETQRLLVSEFPCELSRLWSGIFKSAQYPISMHAEKGQKPLLTLKKQPFIKILTSLFWPPIFFA
jgi:hypothetical protein